MFEIFVRFLRLWRISALTPKVSKWLNFTILFIINDLSIKTLNLAFTYALNLKSEYQMICSQPIVSFFIDMKTIFRAVATQTTGPILPIKLACSVSLVCQPSKLPN